MKSYDVVIIGGGPAGLSAALLFGRGRASALLVDGGTPRNARAIAIHNFVTRDGTPPAEFRAIARGQLGEYPSVEIREALVSRVERFERPDDAGFAFAVAVGDDPEPVRARRVLLTTGMRDELPAIPGLAELWGASVFQCPYCHGWELRDRPWGVLVPSDMMASFAPMLTNWSSHLTAFTHGAAVSEEALAGLRAAGVTVVVEPIARLEGTGLLEGVTLESGERVALSALVVRPPQTAVDLVLALGLDRDEMGYVRVDPRTKESSVPGVHVAGDTTTMMQAAILAAADGMAAAGAMNHALTMDRVARAGAIPR